MLFCLRNKQFRKEYFIQRVDFFIGKKSSDYVMLEYINIHEKCILLEDDNDLFFLSPAVDLLTHSQI